MKKNPCSQKNEKKSNRTQMLPENIISLFDGHAGLPYSTGHMLIGIWTQEGIISKFSDLYEN
jgi:hypothetical protein